MGLYERDYGRDDGVTPWEQHQRSQKPKSFTIILVVVTVAIHFLDMILADQKVEPPSSSLMPIFGCYKDTLLKPWMWFQFLTYGFLHDQQNLMHVGFNMFGLYIFGRPVEERLGRWEFLRVYLFTIFLGGVVGCLTYWAMGIQNGVVIGASGGVMGMTILFACQNPHAKILLMLVFPVKAWIVAVIFVASNLIGSINMLSGPAGQSGTAYSVHLAGIAFALLYHYRHWNLKWLDVSNLSSRVKQSARRSKLKIHDPDAKLRKETDDVDRILAKIHESGEESLTRAERRTLERHSRRQREQRDQRG